MYDLTVRLKYSIYHSFQLSFDCITEIEELLRVERKQKKKILHYVFYEYAALVSLGFPQTY